MIDNYANNVTNTQQERAIMLEALQWYVDQGVDEILLETPLDRTVVPDVADVMAKVPASRMPPAITQPGQAKPVDEVAMLGASEAIIEAQKLSVACKTIDELKQAIEQFDGLSLKKTATNMVFADGNPEADIMLIGEAPGADDDREGKPFTGASGQLLDKVLACIDLNRASEEASQAVYVSNILNWRPPGNRTPTASEINISLPFIERHIALIQPKVLILCGGVTAKALLRRSDTISKIRGSFHDYTVQDDAKSVIPSVTTYAPDYILKTPVQKKAVWADMLMLKEQLDK